MVKQKFLIFYTFFLMITPSQVHSACLCDSDTQTSSDRTPASSADIDLVIRKHADGN